MAHKVNYASYSQWIAESLYKKMKKIEAEEKAKRRKERIDILLGIEK